MCTCKTFRNRNAGISRKPGATLPHLQTLWEVKFVINNNSQTTWRLPFSGKRNELTALRTRYLDGEDIYYWTKRKPIETQLLACFSTFVFAVHVRVLGSSLSWSADAVQPTAQYSSGRLHTSHQERCASVRLFSLSSLFSFWYLSS